MTDSSSPKIEKWSPSSNVYDDLRAVDLLSGPKIPTRSTSTIGYISPRELENPQAKRSTVSLILPGPIASSKRITTLETILSIDDTKRSSSSVELIGQKQKDLVINKDYNVVFEENNQSCICWAIREIIQLICISLLACFIAMFVFTLIFYAFDNYWLEQPIANNSLWWFNNNDTNFTGFDYDTIISTTQIIDYDDEY